MITAALSAVIGLVSGVVPDVLKEWKASREFKRELAMLDKQHELQTKLLDAQTAAKRAELDMTILVEEMKAFKEQMAAIYESAKPLGIRWLDAYNGFQRPFAINLIVLLFVFTAGLFSVGVFLEFLAGRIDMMTAAEVIWASMVGEAIQAVLGFLFGYRSSAKRSAGAR